MNLIITGIINFLPIAFVGLLKKKPTKKIEQLPEVPQSPTVVNQTVDQLEQEFTLQIPTNVKEPSSSFGYAYTGKGYITQETFWFHSCVMLNCINTVRNFLKIYKKKLKFAKRWPFVYLISKLLESSEIIRL